jgi:hypothetical protein
MFDVASALAYLETTLKMLEQLAPMGMQPDVLYAPALFSRLRTPMLSA